MKVTKEEILENWKDHYLTYLIEILNKEYLLDDAIDDIKSFRKINDNNP